MYRQKRNQKCVDRQRGKQKLKNEITEGGPLKGKGNREKETQHDDKSKDTRQKCLQGGGRSWEEGLQSAVSGALVKLSGRFCDEFQGEDRRKKKKVGSECQ